MIHNTQWCSPQNTHNDDDAVSKTCRTKDTILQQKGRKVHRKFVQISSPRVWYLKFQYTDYNDTFKKPSIWYIHLYR